MCIRDSQETADSHAESGGGSRWRSAQVLRPAGAQVPSVEGRGCDHAGALHVLAVLHRLSRLRAATRTA